MNKRRRRFARQEAIVKRKTVPIEAVKAVKDLPVTQQIIELSRGGSLERCRSAISAISAMRSGARDFYKLVSELQEQGMFLEYELDSFDDECWQLPQGDEFVMSAVLLDLRDAGITAGELKFCEANWGNDPYYIVLEDVEVHHYRGGLWLQPHPNANTTNVIRPTVTMAVEA
jgi:hypothetical protein